jgi:uncharacterized membrane protein YidH (DUF202 family)
VKLSARRLPIGSPSILLPALLVVALLGVVVIAATGSTPTGSNRSRSPSHVFVDTFFTLSLVLMAGAAILMIYGLTQRREIAEQMALRKKRRRFGFTSFLAIVLAFTAVAYFRLKANGVNLNRGERAGQTSPRQTLPGDDTLRDYHANFAWLPLLVIAALALASYAAWRLSRKRRAEPEDDESMAETLAQAIESTLGDLRAERDPRRAIIAAYARMERALAAFGVPRRRPETQQEYLERILGGLEVDTEAVRRLTDLYTQAKFSQHEVGAAMKEEAIETLEHVRDELRAAEERRVRELEELEASRT